MSNHDRFFLKKETEVFKSDIKILIPLSIVSIVFWYFIIFDIVERIEYISLVFVSIAWVTTIIKVIFQLPNSYIADDSSKNEKYKIYFFQLLIVSFIFYMFLVGILQHHYSFFESLSCCDLVKNFKLEI